MVKTIRYIAYHIMFTVCCALLAIMATPAVMLSMHFVGGELTSLVFGFIFALGMYIRWEEDVDYKRNYPTLYQARHWYLKERYWL